ncbi:transcription initiation factor IIB family protein [Halosimplex pelagicum]|uniref:Transcription initiation factor IIB family protein n=1 Tax=Halosimplex pelagicum TaxID=869886 RepID=A0A7D5PAR3_9EURY|nr:transcription initiation factor IIB family protein [Halosimplex pelagicum]QLH81965.1 transcription initiation factor IIB family protein [Halosimplex pelagicum]
MTVSSATCPLCGSSETEPINETELLCSECSFIVTGPDKVANEYKQENARSRTSSNSESTTGEWEDKVAVRDSSDGTLVEMIAIAEEFVRALRGDSDNCIKTAEMLAEAWQDQYFQGRSVSVGIAAVIYASFRQQKSPRPLRVVAQTCEISDQQLRTGYRALRTEYDVHSEITPPAMYLPFLRCQLSLDQAVERRAREILSSEIESTGSPTSLASACIYLAAKEQGRSVTLAKVGAACGVSKETVWKKTQEISN